MPLNPRTGGVARPRTSISTQTGSGPASRPAEISHTTDELPDAPSLPLPFHPRARPRQRPGPAASCVPSVVGFPIACSADADWPRKPMQLDQFVQRCRGCQSIPACGYRIGRSALRLPRWPHAKRRSAAVITPHDRPGRCRWTRQAAGVGAHHWCTPTSVRGHDSGHTLP